MKQNIICHKCQTESLVIENELFFSEQKNLEDAICPICENILLQNMTDGWFFVQTIDTLKLEESLNKFPCNHPMP